MGFAFDVAHMLAGLMVVSAARLVAGLGAVALAAWLLFAFNVTSAGWGLILTILLTVVAIYSLRTGLVISAAVLFVVAAGIFALSCISIRKALREYMEYKHRRA